LLALNVPKPWRLTVSPFLTVATTQSKIMFTISADNFFDIPAFSAKCAISDVFVIKNNDELKHYEYKTNSCNFKGFVCF
jgi:hypothetical protein